MIYKKIFLKRSNTAGAVPSLDDLEIGEIAINLADGKIFSKRINGKGDAEIVGLAKSSGGAQGGGSDEVFYLNDQTVTSDYTIPDKKNAMSAGNITINDNVTVTIPDGSHWVIV